MKKYFSYILVLIIILTFGSCNNDAEIKPSNDISSAEQITKEDNLADSENLSESGISLDYFNAGKFTSTIVEDDNCVYFAKSDGIYKKEKQNDNIKLVCLADKPDYLYLYNNKIYFALGNGAGEKRSLCSVNKNGSDCQTVVKEKSDNFPNSLYLADYQIIDDILYIANPGFVYAYNIKTKEIKQWENIKSVAEFQVADDNLYYIDHADKTFTIFDFNLKTSKRNIILGEGNSYPHKDIYRDFIWIEDSLFFYKSMPNGLFCKRNSEEIIIDDGKISNMISVDGQLYYVSFDVFASYFCRYNSKSNEVEQVAILEEFDSSSGISVINGYVYYNSGVNIKKEGKFAVYDYGNSKPVSEKLEIKQ